MAATSSPSNKAKIARRVVEVLEYFDDTHREATVMDIVRRYNRPQSSTSELLSSLVDLGLLRKDPYSRSYRLTARAALLGSLGQSEIVRNGQLVRLIDRVVSQTGLSVALFSMVGLDAQIVSFRGGARASVGSELFGGSKASLPHTAAGWLMLASVERQRRAGILRRINAEAAEPHRFSHGELMARVEACVERNYVIGPAGFGTKSALVATLVPQPPECDVLAIGILYNAKDELTSHSLLQCLCEAMRACLPKTEHVNVKILPNAA